MMDMANEMGYIKLAVRRKTISSHAECHENVYLKAGQMKFANCGDGEDYFPFFAYTIIEKTGD